MSGVFSGLARKYSCAPMVAMIAAGFALTTPEGWVCADDTAPPNDPVAVDDTSKEGETEKKDEKAEKGKGASFIPIPVFITEPAIGYGLGGALGYFHPRKHDADADAASLSPAFTTGTSPAQGTETGKRKIPPTISGIAAAYTEKGTWGVGIGHSASWRKDRMRYVGALVYANVVSTFFLLNNPYDFNLEGALIYQGLKFRIASSDFMLGGKFSYLSADLNFDSDDAPVDYGGTSVADGGLALDAVWDTRDNTMTPNRGQQFELVAWRYDEGFGGDYNYWKGELKLRSFHQFGEKFVLGLRLDGTAIDGDAPLWSYPWISLRGVAALRYQNELAGEFETEFRWNIYTRWAVVAFAGVGATRGDTLIYENESGIVAGGVGGRYLFRPQDSLWVGVDIAAGPESAYAYIQVGHAW